MINKLEKLSAFLSNALIFIAGLLLGWMVLVTSANIILREIWKPLSGAVEIMCYSSALVAAFALGYTQREKANISVDLLFEKYPLWLKKTLNCINFALIAALFLAIGWRLCLYAATLRSAEEVSETLGIIYYPFTYGVAVGCFVLVLTTLVDALKVMTREEENS